MRVSDPDGSRCLSLPAPALLTVQNRLRCGFVHFKSANRTDSSRGELRAHLLKPRSESFNLCLQTGNGRCLFLVLVVLLEKFIEQHRVHRLVTDGVRLSIRLTRNEIGVYLFHILSHESKLWNALGVKLMLVVEGDRFKRED